MKSPLPIKRIIPRSILAKGIYVIYSLYDLYLLLGKKDPTIPPTRLMFDGPRDPTIFKKNGEEFLRYFIEFCSLKSNERVLDVGCGIGRKAIPLTKYLDSNAQYEGFDIIQTGVRWCKENVSSRNPNFNFQFVDVFNKSYNPKGRFLPSCFKFPFDNETFDFVFLGSVFTHMMPIDVKNYFIEISRVLKSGGRCLVSFFLSNGETLELINAKKSSLNFAFRNGEYMLEDRDEPEYAVCYDEPYIIDLFTNNKLKINLPVHYGSWCGRKNFLSYQDIIVATKI
jgi:SAM-dependent methyltransferase